MITKEKAAATTTAQNNKLQKQAYQKIASLSSTKLQLGILLLHLQTPLSKNQTQRYWHQFNSMLRRYANMKIYEEVE